MKTDAIVFAVTEGTLILAFAIVLGKDIWIRHKSKHSGVIAEVTRGEQSMNALYVNFGIATVVFTLIVQACDTLKGNQVLFIVLNYVMLTYMFFFSSWFRNTVFFKMTERIKKD
jgi:hypothetical protein